MAKKHYEQAVAQTAEWLTPKPLLDQIGLKYDLDPCSPGAGLCHVPAATVYTKADDGLRQPWRGLTFVNPPFNKDEGAKRDGIIPWLVKFFDHRDGILLVRAQTSCGWWHQYIAPNAELILFVEGKTRFVRKDGSVGKQPTSGVALIAAGEAARAALLRSGLGVCVVVVEPSRVLQIGGQYEKVELAAEIVMAAERAKGGAP
jgi:hypothetical protein